MSHSRSSLKFLLVGLAILALGILVGRMTSSSSSEKHDGHSEQSNSPTSPETWTCSMHPQIQLPKEGKCPICFMDLIPLESSDDEELGERSLKMSEAAMALAEIETQALERREAEVIVDMVGKMDVDTTRITDIHLLADAEIRRLFVNYTGIPVKKGQHLAQVYSPSVYAAAQDLLIALQSESKDQELVRSSVTKLKLLGVPQAYIDTIQKEKTVPETFTLKSPIDGYVEDLVGYQGLWVKKGERLCRVVDMHSLWAHFDAYESDLAWIRYGQSVSIEARALPGQTFKGVISYIPPRLDDRSRTVKVRVNVENPDGRLKPGMFVSAKLSAKVTGSGQVTSPELEGKWISPMHPEIIKDGPGSCDVCGMDLVRIEDLGLETSSSESLPLLLPKSAVLITGKRAVAYVRIPGEKPVFEGREVELGPKAGEHYVVLSGLREGEDVVVKGNFKIDSALQIQAKPSMMSVEGESSLIKTPSNHEAFSIDNPPLRQSLKDYLETYLRIQEKLANDDYSEVRTLTEKWKNHLAATDGSSLQPKELALWNRLRENLEQSKEHLEHHGDIESYREHFKTVSKAVINTIEKIGHPMNSLHRMSCSMADGEWLQAGDLLANPYYGSSMLRCGTEEPPLPMIPQQH